MMGEWNMQQPSLHAANPNVGKTIQPPPGSWVVERSIFLGKVYIHVYHVGVKALEAA